ncbi:WXG100 family type VII secretion target [Nocardia jiangsuensis]|uniref:WXG100 family type VII secretion target n=1 Tax=Nocardia jiangsuensis TaxID=1691563 RepID=A0ABV8DTL1_9NOCA
MATLMNVSPESIQASAGKTAAGLGELESHLKGLSGAQDELYAAVQGQTGDAIYQAMSQAYTSGKALAGTLQEIVDAMTAVGANFDAADLDSAGQFYRDLGTDGKLDTGAGFGGGSKLNMNF